MAALAGDIVKSIATDLAKSYFDQLAGAVTGNEPVNFAQQVRCVLQLCKTAGAS